MRSYYGSTWFGKNTKLQFFNKYRIYSNTIRILFKPAPLIEPAVVLSKFPIIPAANRAFHEIEPMDCNRINTVNISKSEVQFFVPRFLFTGTFCVNLTANVNAELYQSNGRLTESANSDWLKKGWCEILLIFLRVH